MAELRDGSPYALASAGSPPCPQPSLPIQLTALSYLPLGMGRGWDRFTSPGGGLSGGGGVSGGVPGAGLTSSGELLR